MSIGRSLFNEIRPLFRLLEEPFGRAGAGFYGGYPSLSNPRAIDPFNNLITRPAVDISEQGEQYIVDADLPGIKKENLEIRLGDNGESLTIQGKIVGRGRSQPATEDSGSSKENATAQAITEKDESHTQISAERPVNYSNNFSFTRTVWLPQPVDPKSVSAKLENGVLTVILQKAKENKESTVIPID
ncbi:hypothetical protein CC1G_15006 [Coprinopsis cinerea okayama7|uniref:SHSP domain-containing protein n=1 Tax=Coprinopsis cinerea (strain Okayama-7 / 130 / ATCC MYA-4618 / FGSC 9003) TaxID=240176 RepID=D6RP58_COPC7|nr:hypothetical protein CC1G_15006 [Coprinopsis cinerea okayama7\|eukprot:XP_002910675.1 hypothetical protein CC1G_15006 [Coprinopsis cinerea okayama7\